MNLDEENGQTQWNQISNRIFLALIGLWHYRFLFVPTLSIQKSLSVSTSSSMKAVTNGG